MKRVHASTHVFVNVKLTNWRGRWESEGPRNKVPQGSVQSLELFILEKESLRGDMRSQVSKTVTRYRERERAQVRSQQRL